MPRDDRWELFSVDELLALLASLEDAEGPTAQRLFRQVDGYLARLRRQ